MPRPQCLVILLLTAACQSVAPALHPTAPEPEPESTLNWSGISDNSAQCPSISFKLVQKERMLEGSVTGAGGQHLLSEIRGIIEDSDVRVAVDRTVWIGNRGSNGITLQEAAGCRRRVVLTHSP